MATPSDIIEQFLGAIEVVEDNLNNSKNALKAFVAKLDKVRDRFSQQQNGRGSLNLSITTAPSGRSAEFAAKWLGKDSKLVFEVEHPSQRILHSTEFDPALVAVKKARNPDFAASQPEVLAPDEAIPFMLVMAFLREVVDLTQESIKGVSK